MVFDSKHDFAPPTILLGLLLCPWMWGTTSKLLQGHVASTPAPTILLGLLCPWTWDISSKKIHKADSFFFFLAYLYYKFKITIYIYNTFTHSHSETLVWIRVKVDRKRMVKGLFLCPKKSSSCASWWFSGKESICQCRRHRFDPLSRKILHALHCNNWTCALDARNCNSEATSCKYWSLCTLESVLHNKRSQCNVKTCITTRE